MEKLIQELNAKHIRSWNAHLKRDEKIEKLIEDLKKKKGKLRWLGFEQTFRPLFEILLKKLKAICYELYGPFGMSAEQTAYFLKDKENKDICKKGNVLGSLCFISDRQGYALRNENVDTKSFGEGSIAAMNGANHPTIKFSNKMTIKWLVNFAKRGR